MYNFHNVISICICTGVGEAVPPPSLSLEPSDVVQDNRLNFNTSILTPSTVSCNTSQILYNIIYSAQH